MNKSNPTAATEIASKHALLAALVKKNLRGPNPVYCYWCEAS